MNKNDASLNRIRQELFILRLKNRKLKKYILWQNAPKKALKKPLIYSDIALMNS